MIKFEVRCGTYNSMSPEAAREGFLGVERTKSPLRKGEAAGDMRDL